MMRSYVGRDRYELGITLTTAIVPGASGIMGLLFATIGFATLGRRPVPVQQATSPKDDGMGLVFAVLGLATLKFMA